MTPGDGRVPRAALSESRPDPEQDPTERDQDSDREYTLATHYKARLLSGGSSLLQVWRHLDICSIGSPVAQLHKNRDLCSQTA
jgi:hypothetical protein